MQLIKQMQHDRDALVVYPEIHLETPDQSRPRKIGLRKQKFLLADDRQQRFRCNPGIQCRRIQMRSIDEFLALHRYTPMNCRGLSAAGCHPATTLSSSASRFCGSISISVTYGSPLLPSERAIPRPFNRRTRPVLDHFGTASVTAPPGVGTLTFAPSTASFREIGKSRWMSSPIRVK